jgi:hypothetical protein
MKVLKLDHLNKVNYGSRTRSIRYCFFEVEWLHELLMDLPVVEKTTPTIFMNYDN